MRFSKVNRERNAIIYGGAALVVASLLFIFFYTGEPPAVTPVGEQVGKNQTQSKDQINLSDELHRSQQLSADKKVQLNFTDNIALVLSAGQLGVPSSGHHGGGRVAGGGGGGGAVGGGGTGGGGGMTPSYSLLLNGTEIVVGSGISGTATTNNTAITKVEFLWKDPGDVVSANHTKATINGITNDAFTAPNQTGRWTVQAHFLDNANNDASNITRNFVVIQPGGSQFAYSLTVEPNPVGQNAQINANATTNNTGITKVKFEWILMSGTTKTLKATQERSVNSTSLSVIDSFTPDTIGNWTVVAHFNNSTHSDVAIKVADFTVIDKTPPVVKGKFSRDPDIEDGSAISWYIRPVTITWLCEDVGGSGVRSVDPAINYSSPNGPGMVLEGKCTDNAGNVGTGSVRFNYDTSGGITGKLIHFYDLSLSSNSVSLGSSISANATTNNTGIKAVKFAWINPSNVTVATNVVLTVANGDVSSAVNVFTGLDQTGIWAVDAHFLDAANNDVIDIQKFFSVVQVGGDLFGYELKVTPETVTKNDQVKANATTDNPSINNVTFVWTNPAHDTVTNIVPVPPGGGNSLFRSAIDLIFPNMTGNWRVEAHFNNATNLDVALRIAFFTVREGGAGGGGGNHAPVAMDDTAATLKNNPIVIDVVSNDFDIDQGDHLAISSFTQPGNGSATKSSNETFTYIPKHDFVGLDSFTYRISDGALESNFANVRITVTPENHAPVAIAGPDQTVTICANSTDDEHDHDDQEHDDHGKEKDDNHKSNGNSHKAESSVHSAQSKATAWANNRDDDERSNEHRKDGKHRCSKNPVVVLDGSASFDADGDVLTYSWHQTGGPTVGLNNPTSVSPSLSAPKVDRNTTLTFELTVKDPFGAKSTDSVNIILLSKGHGGDGDHDCNNSEDDNNCKCEDEGDNEKGAKDHDDKCNEEGGSHDDDKNNGKGGTGDNKGKQDDQGSGVNDKGNSGGDNKDHDNKGSNDSGQGGGSQNNSGSNNEHEGAHDKNSGSKEKHEHKSSEGSKGGGQGSKDNGSGRENNGNDEGSSKGGSGNDNGAKNNNHDKKHGVDKQLATTRNDFELAGVFIESLVKFGSLLSGLFV